MNAPEIDGARATLDDATLAFAHRMFDLARDGQADELAAYVDAGLPPNLTNDKGDTLLILAAYHGHPAAVAALLDRGAAHARLNDRGQSALAAATFRRSADAVRALLDAGADPHLGRQSAVATATFFELPEMLELLTAGHPS
jgi:ankyrin repeat protein